MPALSDLEPLVLDGIEYEAFHTSGGIGSLVDTYLGRIKNLDYKTIRYPGHCHKMTFLLQDLKLKNNPNLAKQILTNAIPYTRQDKVVIYVSVEGKKDGQLCEVNYTKVLYPLEISGYQYTAIQVATASSIYVIVDMVVHEKKISGLIRQEQISLDDFLANRFGQYYTKSESRHYERQRSNLDD
jgi:saccharopine dehydrogenase-like NADP-dependent oxidoreductase